MNKKELLERLMAPLPEEAVEVDGSRGFELIGFKVAYIIERLNEVFGPCGLGWTFTVKKMTVEEDVVYCDGELAYYVEDGEGRWSKPIPCYGDCSIAGMRVGDARKGAMSDALKKGASLLGVGHQAYKKLLSAPGVHTTQLEQATVPSAAGEGAEKHWSQNAATVGKLLVWAAEHGVGKADVLAALGVNDIRDYQGTKEQALRAITAMPKYKGKARRPPEGTPHAHVRWQDSPEIHEWVTEKVGLSDADIIDALGMPLAMFSGNEAEFKARVMAYVNRKCAASLRAG